MPDNRLPIGDEIVLDHVGHFVADVEAARQALEACGFVTTPVAVHTHQTAGQEPQPSGTGNCCVMLERGYLEILFQTADTPLGRQFANALARHAGVHLAAFAVADASHAHGQLEREGFAVQPPVSLSRPVSLGNDAGEAEARFSVVRVNPAAMPEGRIQILTHHTEAVVWQPRWLSHPNGARGLSMLVVVVEEPGEAAPRWARFLNRSVEWIEGGAVVTTERGRIFFFSPARWREILPDHPAATAPAFALYGVSVHSLAKTARWLAERGFDAQSRLGGLIVPFPTALGQGAWLFTDEGKALIFDDPLIHSRTV